MCPCVAGPAGDNLCPVLMAGESSVTRMYSAGHLAQGGTQLIQVFPDDPFLPFLGWISIPAHI